MAIRMGIHWMMDDPVGALDKGLKTLPWTANVWKR